MGFNSIQPNENESDTNNSIGNKGVQPDNQVNNGYNNLNMNQTNNGYSNPNMNQANNGYSNPNMNQTNNGYSNPNMNQANNGYNNPNMNQANNGYSNPNMNQANNGYNNSNMNQVNSSFNSNKSAYTNINASAGSRIIAYLLDFLIMLPISFVIFVIGTFASIILRSSGASVEGNSLLSLLQTGVPMFLIWFSHPILSLFGLVGKKHSTFGQRKKHIRVINDDGTDITFGQSFLRFVLMCLIPHFSLICMLVTKDGKALHDIILKQTVINSDD